MDSENAFKKRGYDLKKLNFKDQDTKQSVLQKKIWNGMFQCSQFSLYL